MKSKLNPNAQLSHPLSYPERKKLREIKKILKDIIPSKQDFVNSQGGFGATPIEGIAKENFDPKCKLNQTDNRY